VKKLKVDTCGVEEEEEIFKANKLVRSVVIFDGREKYQGP
jgi:hypothetical protein